MNRRLVALVLTLALVLGSLSVLAAPQDTTVRYKGKLRFSAVVFGDEKMTQRLGKMDIGTPIEIIEYKPETLTILYKGKVAYILRKTFDDYSVETLFPGKIPNYPTVESQYIAYVARETAVLAEPKPGAEALITLQKGARLALLGFEGGWAKLIFHRQFGYLNTEDLVDLLPVQSPDAPLDKSLPISAYTSFYKITTDKDNLNRIKNLEVSCEKLEKLTLKPGDRFDFNRVMGPYNARSGYFPAWVLSEGESVLGYGGGTCQISSTLYNVVLQLTGVQVVYRRSHGPASISYLPHGADAAVGNPTQNFIIKNHYPFPIRIDGTVQDGALTLAIYRAD